LIDSVYTALGYPALRPTGSTEIKEEGDGMRIDAETGARVSNCFPEMISLEAVGFA
jgi:hypothetical protein